MDIKQFVDKGIVSLGNLYRISKVMKKAAAGGDITVGMLGGSITQGSLSSTPETCYAYLVYQWWVNKFKDSKVTYINGGIGGTTSQFGVARVESDMLIHEPDFIITEFSVNDSETDLFQETYEGLIRKMLQYKSEPALFILNNVQYNDGVNAQAIHNEIGAAYDLPIVSIKNSLYPEVESGRIPNTDITPDDLHPNDLGHKIVSEIVINALEKIYNEVFFGKITDNYEIPEKTITQNRYMDSIRYNNKNIEPALNGFAPDLVKQERITDIFRNGFIGRRIGDSIHFEITGGMISVQYCKTIKRIAPIAKAVIDGDEAHPIILDANFEQTWGDCLYLQDLLIAGENKKHTLDITITSVDKDSDIDFYLVSVIVANR
jgi:acyl-CoA thioesterase I